MEQHRSIGFHLGCTHYCCYTFIDLHGIFEIKMSILQCCPIKKLIYDVCNNVKGAVTSVINCVAMTRTRIGQDYYFKAIASSSSTVAVR